MRHNLHDCHASVRVFPRPAETQVIVDDASLGHDGEVRRITTIDCGSVVTLQWHDPAAARLWLEATLLSLDAVVHLEVETVSGP